MYVYVSTCARLYIVLVLVQLMRVLYDSACSATKTETRRPAKNTKKTSAVFVSRSWRLQVSSRTRPEVVTYQAPGCVTSTARSHHVIFFSEFFLATRTALVTWREGWVVKEENFAELAEKEEDG